MALAYVNDIVIPASMKMLPAKMDSLSARAMLLAIGLQESRFTHRRQIKGPARSFWQAESGGGFRGILFHEQTRDAARGVLLRMGYGEPDESDFLAIEHNDILACCGARLLLWTHPAPLPSMNDPQGGWDYYIETWRPGKPHRQTWDEFYRQAWGML
jgi:hypothetical protein